MKNTDKYLNKIKAKLKKTKKQKILCVSTTANINNPKIIFGPMRETEKTIAGNIILRSAFHIDKIISTFDGFVDYFFIDSEIKNQVKNLQTILIKKIKKSDFLIYKPNDFTVEALDMLIACKIKTLINSNILIVGVGNIGSKTAIKLCERGANVSLFSKNTKKTAQIVTGLNIFVKSNKKIKVLKNIKNLKQNIDILIGCTPGIPIISDELISKVKQDGLIIDVGIGTIDKNQYTQIHNKNINVHRLSSMAGYVGMIETWLSTKKQLQNRTTKKIGDSISLISPGIIGVKGDIIVDNISNPTKMFGICDGTGDVLSGKEYEKYIDLMEDKIYDVRILKKIKKLC